MTAQELKEAFTPMLDEGIQNKEILGYSINDSEGGTITIVIRPQPKQAEENILTITT